MSSEAVYRKRLREAKRANCPLVECAAHGCSHKFRPTRAGHLFCSSRCKVAAWRESQYGRFQVTDDNGGHVQVTGALKANATAAMFLR